MHVTNGHRIRRKVGIDLHKGARPDRIPLVHTHTMTLTERNQKLYDLRQQLDRKRMELAWIETEIMATKQQYKDQQRFADGDLFQQMFGDDPWEQLDRLG